MDNQHFLSPSASHMSFSSSADISDLRNVNLEAPLSAKDVVAISISGCTSSGKTSLAKLLSAIFHLGLKKHTVRSHPPVIIQQDNYFINKQKVSTCNIFRPTLRDAEFVRASVGKGTWRQVSVGESASSIVQEKTKGHEKSVIIKHQDTTEGSGIGNSRTAPLPDPALVWSVDTDTWDAVDLARMAEDLTLLRDTSSRGQEYRETNAIQANSFHHVCAEAAVTKHPHDLNQLRNTPYSTSPSSQNNNHFILEWAQSEVFHRLVEVVEDWASQKSLLFGKEIPTLGIVEGFLLYAEPGRDPEHVKHQISQHLDIKLFIPTTKETARQRRFLRPAYVDVRHSGTRAAGEMWKTEGYFEDVAWANYVKESKWILDGDHPGAFKDTEEGRGKASDIGFEGSHILVSPLVDVDMGAMMEWAIRVILEELNDLMGVDHIFSSQSTYLE
ncbi:Nicotinamide riboside kinase [Phlyctema vagabunda]|uniref:Nicotinamide riboside kinase n=1 Tax=Phlyctema vagabunda TaxID=108571 RepID=A0ABR4P9B8_9HELO